MELEKPASEEEPKLNPLKIKTAEAMKKIFP
jgi:hypothetical protein